MVDTLFSLPIMKDVILPFLLVFTVIFAILERTKLLGEGKKQVDALVALAVGLITVSYAYATNVISRLMPFLAIFAVILLIFMILYGFIAGEKEEINLSKTIKVIIGLIIVAAILVAVIWVSGLWERFLSPEISQSVIMNVVFAIIIIAAIVAVVVKKKG